MIIKRGIFYLEIADRGDGTFGYSFTVFGEYEIRGAEGFKTFQEARSMALDDVEDAATELDILVGDLRYSELKP